MNKKRITSKDFRYKDRFVFAQLVKVALFTRTKSGVLVRNHSKYTKLFTRESKVCLFIATELNFGVEMVRRTLLRLKLQGYYRFDKERGCVIIEKRIDFGEDSKPFYTKIPVYMRKTFYLKDGAKVTWTALEQMIFDYVNSVRKIYIERKQKNEMLLQIQGIFYQKINTIAKRFGLSRQEVIGVINKFKQLFGTRCFRRAYITDKYFRKHPYSKTYTLEPPLPNELRKVITKFEAEKCERIVHRERLKGTFAFFNEDGYEVDHREAC